MESLHGTKGLREASVTPSRHRAPNQSPSLIFLVVLIAYIEDYLRNIMLSLEDIDLGVESLPTMSEAAKVD